LTGVGIKLILGGLRQDFLVTASMTLEAMGAAKCVYNDITRTLDLYTFTTRQPPQICLY